MPNDEPVKPIPPAELDWTTEEEEAFKLLEQKDQSNGAPKIHT